MMTTPRRTTAAELVEAVAAVPGVRGIEPGIASALRAVDARLRRGGDARVHYGAVIDETANTVTIEVGLSRDPAPVRGTVALIQRTVREALAGTLPPGTIIHVKVQSLT